MRGREAVRLPGAFAQVDTLNSESKPGEAEVFIIAYRDIPAWQRLSDDEAKRSVL